MESAEELTTPPTPKEFQDPFEYVPRKRKINKKGRYFYRTNKQQNSDDANQPINEEIKEISTDTSDNHGDEHKTEDEENESRITLDSVLKTKPEIEDPNEFSPSKVKEHIDDLKTPEISSVFNTRALPKHSRTYELEEFDKNALFIFSHQNVNGYLPNMDVERDEADLTKVFSKFGFDVHVERDLTKQELMDKLREFSKQDFTDYGCVAVAILTIGSTDDDDDESDESKVLIWAKDEKYSELELIKHFKVDARPFLITKPKIFIVQATQAEQFRYRQLHYKVARVRADIDKDKEPYTLPVESDMLLIHSIYSGKPANSAEPGSWFIKKLCSKIDELSSTHDIEDILTQVKYEIGTDRSEHKDTAEYWLKIPVTTSTFIRKLYLKTAEETPSSYADHTQLDDIEPILDSDIDNVPKTESKLQVDSCSCFLKHFDYMKECLKQFLEDQPDDLTARSFYNVAVTFKEGVEFNSAKEEMLQTIYNHLSNVEKPHHGLKYLHSYHKTD